jgi:hypothetical protein
MPCHCGLENCESGTPFLGIEIFEKYINVLRYFLEENNNMTTSRNILLQ